MFWPHPSPAVVRHHLQVDIDPANSRFTARDRVLLPSDRPVPARLAFTLHADLDPASPDGKVVALDTLNVPSGPMQATYAISLPAGADSFTLRYGGTIAHPLGEVGEESARGQRHTVGAIGPEGVYLDGGSGWYPGLPEDPDVVFDLSVRLPPGWDAVSQGDRASRGRTDRGTTVRWTCDLPQEGIWLAAGPWTETSRVANGVEGMVFLRAPDSELAGRYLDATERYVALYSSLLGPYPYRKFAVAENFWETGYGMPSFTLLGPRVIRFPFILDSSYPHEILHNWWGNGVRIDYASGNWGEGLTAYLADHLMKERKGEDVAHRQETLQKYADYVLQGRDLPLSAFRSRHGSVTEAVGYGKSMMLYHMLRRDLGDEAFVGGLRDLYRRNLHRRAAFTQVREAFEAASGRDLGPFFRQWVDREGAPDLVLEGVRAAAPADSRRLSVTLRQAQPGEPFRLEVPVAVTVEGKEDAVTVVVPMEGRTATTQIALDARPLRVDVDPAFDLFRRLDRREIPPALTQAFGAQDAVLVLPAGAPAGLRDAYGRLAQSLARTGPGKVEVTDDGKLGAPPPGRSVWVLGSENRLASWVEGALTGYPVRVEAGRVTLGGTAVDAPSALVLTARRPDNADLALLWIVLGDPAAAEGLARKLPHYHKYSYLAFVGTEPENAAKGRWPVVGSPLTAQTGKGDAPMARLPARPLLTAAAAAIDGGRMMDAIVALSADVMKGRGLGTPELDRAADLIAQEFLLAGIKPSGDGEGYFQSWREPVGTGGPDTALRNVLAVLPGSDPALSSQFVLVGAHYDHLGTGGPGALSFNLGRVHPGADDNASGVAVMLELARSLSASPPPRPVLFAAFTGEERGRLGSSRYVAHPALPLADTVAMVNLDTLGRLGKGPLLAMGSDSSAGWAPILARAGSAAGTSIQATAPDLDSGDQEVLLSAGVPSVGLFTGAHEDYHRPTDTADRIDARGLVRAATAARAIVWELASAKEPMARIPTAAPRHGQGADGATGERKVSIGAVPDFAYQGKGVRLSGTAAGSPAERAGLLAGDVITAVDGQPVASLRDFSAVLKAREAGDNVTLTFTRDGVRHAVTVVVEAR